MTKIPPGPKGHPVFGNLPAFRRDPLALMEECQNDYGPVVRLKFGRLETWVVTDPDLIDVVLSTEQRNFIKPLALQNGRRLFGNGLLTSEGHFWLKQRRLLQPLFTPESAKRHVATIVEVTEKKSKQIEDGEIVDVYQFVPALTAEIAMRTVLGKSDERVSRLFQKAFRLANVQVEGRRGAGRFIPASFQTPSNRRFADAIRNLDAEIYQIMEETRESKNDGDSPLSLLIKEQGKENSIITDEQIRDELTTLLIGTSDAPSMGLMWALYLLAQNPGALEKLQLELATVLGERPPQMDDVKNLLFTRMVWLEALRLYPPVWSIGRAAITDCPLGDYTVPRGMQILMNAWAVQRDPRRFEDALTFKPERWDNDFQSTLHKYDYFPFGGGARVCIGADMSMLLGVLVLATFARRWSPQYLGDSHPKMWPVMSLRVRTSVPMQMNRWQ